MSDYTQITDFSAKDALLTGDPNKIIYGSAFDAEFAAIAVAVATKYDSTDLASEVEAQNETLNTVLITPLRLSSWSEANDGLVADLHAVSGLAAGGDKLFFFDDTDDTLKALTVGTGLAITTTTIASDDANIDHDALSNFVADEHVAHSGVTLTAGAGLTGGGTIAASRSFAVGAGDGITVNADDVALAASSAGNGLSYASGVLSITDQAASTTVPVSLSSGTLGFDVTALTDFGTTVGVDLDTDTLILSDGPGTNKEVKASQLVTPEVVTVSDATDTLAETDFGQTILYSNAAPAITLPNGLKAGFWATLLYTGTPGAGLSLSATTTLNTANSYTTITTQYAGVTVFHAGSNVWYAWGALDS